MENWNNDDEWDIKEPKWKRAVDFANKYHTASGQYRIGKNGEKLPYMTHIHEVMKILTSEAKITSDDVLTVAALHDVVEDTECTLDEIKEEFGEDIAECVDLLTRKEGQPFDDYAKRIFTNEKYPWLGDIKLADRIHNLRTYPEVGDNKKIKYKYDETVRCIKPYAKKQSPILNKKLDESMQMITDFLGDSEVEY